ncbi:Mu-like prophage FluMu protein gp28 [Salmonella enterica subsp. enterica serovar Typhi]|nr:Mu-like prophage FluMu protein gp28 [Salmonella enterica subsp. enterica serovar Typhi]CGN15528.1 Mu-like prophage FluMu protein gp28 [Salmonella enterica subsp. enterica serovar Typhi]
MTKSSGVILNAAGGGPEGMSPMDGRNNLAPVLPDTSALDAPPVLLPYQQRWVADTSPLKVIEKSRRTGITWAEASDNVLTAASSAPAGGMNVYYIAYNQDMTVEYIQACAMWARAFNYAASEIEEGFWEEDDDDTLPPKRAVSYLKSKGYQITWDWEEMWQEAHARAFTVAKVTRLDILEDIRGALQQAVDEGKTDRWFRQELEPVLKRKGWWGPRDTTDPVTGKPVTIQQGSPWRLDTIFRTNMSVLYSAGRWAEQMENVDDRPYWMYTGINDSHTRRSHLALHGLVLRWDDPFWQAFYPPNGWRCRCSVIALSATDVRARGLKVISSGSAMGQELKLVSEKTGEMRNVATFNTGTTKVTTDVGWSYAPGAAYRPDSHWHNRN